MKLQRLSVLDIVAMKRRGERIAAVTAYDYTSGQIVDAAGIPFVLVGDTLGMVVQGHETTLPVTLDHIIYHSQMVERGTRRALLVGDLPFMTYQVSIEDALRNAARLMKDGRVGAVKVEGGREIAGTVERLVRAGIPVCGHLGFTPQSTHAKGGPRIQARDAETALAMVSDAKALEDAGAFAIVLELVPAIVAQAISERLTIPTIGIGAGPFCDGEIQVFHDLCGLYTDFQPRHTKRYLNGAHDMVAAMREFAREVATRKFPGPEQTSDLKTESAERFRALLDS
jgi:3-methyl-2-oxobutanoate hydroxymethyltransferase